MATVKLSKIPKEEEDNSKYLIKINGLVNKFLTRELIVVIKGLIYNTGVEANFTTVSDVHFIQTYNSNDKNKIIDVLKGDSRTCQLVLNFDNSDRESYRFLIKNLSVDNCKFEYCMRNNIDIDKLDPRDINLIIQSKLQEQFPAVRVSSNFGPFVIFSTESKEMEEYLLENPIQTIANSRCTIYRYPAVKICKKCLIIGHLEGECISTNLKCFHCLDEQHLYNNCPLTSKSDCFLCRKDTKKYGRQVRHPPGARNCGYIIYHLINEPGVIYPEVVDTTENEAIDD